MTSPSAPTNPGTAASPDNPRDTDPGAGASTGAGAGTASGASSGTSAAGAADGPIGQDLTGDGPLSPEEAADRKAAEDAWIAYDAAALGLWAQPEDQWKQILTQYATGEIITRAVEGTGELVDQGNGNWGDPVHRLYWKRSIGSADHARLGDCIDSRAMGVMDAQTNEKLTIGIEHDNTLIDLNRTDDSTWKVDNVRYMVNIACPGAELTPGEEVTQAQQSASSTEEPSS